MIEQLARQIANDLNSLFAESKPDGDKVKVLLEAALRKLKLVSREEFDAQAAVLQRTRSKLKTLEAKLSELEKILEAQAQTDINSGN